MAPPASSIKGRAVAARLRQMRSNLAASVVASVVVDIVVRGVVNGTNGALARGTDLLLFVGLASVIYLWFRRDIVKARLFRPGWLRRSPWLWPYWIGAVAIIAFFAGMASR